MRNEAELDLLNNDSPHKGPVILSFVIFFVVIQNKLLNKYSNYHWYERPSFLCDKHIAVLVHDWNT